MEPIKLTSLTDLVDEASGISDTGPLEVLRTGKDASFISLFTLHGLSVQRHYLEATSVWRGGYYRCLGGGCPACRAGKAPQDVLRLPVIDRLTARIKLLEIPIKQGPGTLMSELSPVLHTPEPERLVIRIAKDGQYTFNVSIQREMELDPELASVIKAFTERLNADPTLLEAGLTHISAEDMETHEHIARSLKLVESAQ